MKAENALADETCIRVDRTSDQADELSVIDTGNELESK